MLVVAQKTIYKARPLSTQVQTDFVNSETTLILVLFVKLWIFSLVDTKNWILILICWVFPLYEEKIKFWKT